MQISTKIIVDMETGIVLLREYYAYNGPLEYACGSGDLGSLEQTQVSTASTLASDANTVFAGNENILANITGVLNPMIQPGQFGYTPEETAAKRSEAADSIAAAGRQAAGKTGEAIAAIGGGNSVLPSGSKDAILGQQAEQVAQAQAAAQEEITTAGYDTGRQQQQFAIQEMAKAPGELQDPAIQMQKNVTAAQGLATNTENQQLSANRAWIAPLTDIITGGEKLAAGPLGSMGGKGGGAAATPAATGR